MNRKVIEKLEKWMKNEKVAPEKVQIYPTNKCNLNCIFCAQRNDNYGYDSELSKDRWKEVVREISQMNVSRLLISGGGEPFSKPETTLELMKIAKKNNMEGRIITNGTLMNQEIIETLIDIQWDTVVFSIDSPNAKTHDGLRGRKGAFKRAINNLKNLEDTRNERRTKIEINFVLNERNYKEIPEMIDFSSSLNVDSINFEPITVNNPEDATLKLSENQREKLVNRIIPEARKLEDTKDLETNLNELKDIKVEKSGEMKEEIIKESKKKTNSLKDSPCYEPWLWPKIEANGDVWPCSTTPLHENVSEKSFKEIWYGEEFEEFRKKILRKELPESCQNCVTTHVEINKRIKERLKSQSN